MAKQGGSKARPRKARSAASSSPSPTFTFTLYTKQRCELCDRARMLLEDLGAGRTFQVDEVDIEAEGGAILREYAVRVPVVRSPQGKEIDLWIEPAELERFVRSVIG